MEDEDSSLYHTINSFFLIDPIIHTDNGRYGDISDNCFCNRVYENLLNNNEKNIFQSLYFFITPTISTSFILHIMLSIGNFETEIDIILHGSIRESLRCFHLIGPENDN